MRWLSPRQWGCSSNSPRDVQRPSSGSPSSRWTHQVRSNQQQFRHEEAGESPCSGGDTDWTPQQAASPGMTWNWQVTLIKSSLTHLLQYIIRMALRLSKWHTQGAQTQSDPPSRLGATGSQGRRLRKHLTNCPGESCVPQKLRRRQGAFLEKTSTLMQTSLHPDNPHSDGLSNRPYRHQTICNTCFQMCTWPGSKCMCGYTHGQINGNTQNRRDN